MRRGVFNTGEAKLYYELAGSGPTVVLIHGHSVDSRMWDRQFESLSSRYQVLRYDLRGYGRSDIPMEGHHYLHANDLYRLMNGLGIEKAHLVGLSLGSFVALDFFAVYSQSVLSVSVASGAIYADDGEEPPDSENIQQNKELVTD